jgi:hypothetical protein
MLVEEGVEARNVNGILGLLCMEHFPGLVCHRMIELLLHRSPSGQFGDDGLWVALVFACLVHLVMHLALWDTCDTLVIFGQLRWNLFGLIVLSVIYIVMYVIYVMDVINMWCVFGWISYICDIFCLSWWNANKKNAVLDHFAECHE